MYRSKIDERVSEAVAQLMETAKQESEAFRLVALLARTTVGSDITTGQIFGTLYGERGILHVDKNGITLHTGCLYFSRSAFFKNKELDGVLVIDDAGGPCLCVNDYGRRVETFRKSGLAEWFAQHGALNYAERLETVGGFFVVHQVIDPPDPKAALQYVRDRYGLGGCTETHLAEYTAMSTLR
jgi:hypothetical protein